MKRLFVNAVLLLASLVVMAIVVVDISRGFFGWP
jgi:hypothetical protein